MTITSKNISFTHLHQVTPSIRDISLTIQAGECVLITGRSGSGKTTYSRILNGLSPEYFEGDLSGENWTLTMKAGEAPIEAYAAHVGSVFQNPKSQHFNINTTHEMAFPCENQGVEPEAIQERIQEVAQAFGIEHLLDRNIFELSGGEKQLIAFGAAAMMDPDVYILDEVTSNLDAQAIASVARIIRLLKSQGRTIVIFDHRLAWTTDFVDRYLYFNQGALTQEWTREALLGLSEVEREALGLRPTDLSPYKATLQTKRIQPIVSDMGLSAKKLAIGYDIHKPVKMDLNFTLEPGQVTGLMGPNGSGKSTLARTLVGLEKPIAGEVRWQGQAQKPKVLTKQAFLVMQDTNYQLFSDSVEQEILLGAAFPERISDILEQLSLTDVREQHPMSLSGGQKQRVMIASALLSGKPFVVFDEPTSGLDMDNMMRFGEVLSYLKSQGFVVLLITHDEELAALWCDQILNMQEL